MTAEQLANALENGADADRVAAAQALASGDPESAGPAAASLVRGASDEVVAEWCVAALEEMGPPPTELLGELTGLLGGPADSAYWAATLIGRLGGDAAPAVPALASLAAGDAADAARERAVWALGKIGPAAADAKPTLAALANSDQPRLARLANKALESIGG